jgi:hypothetical protein
MNATRIHKRIDSDTLYLPELKQMLGKTVEIIVLEEPAAEADSEKDWQPLFEAAGQDLVDPEAYKELRAASVMHP